jgi:hypothetical protein
MPDTDTLLSEEGLAPWTQAVLPGCRSTPLRAKYHSLRPPSRRRPDYQSVKSRFMDCFKKALAKHEPEPIRGLEAYQLAVPLRQKRFDPNLTQAMPSPRLYPAKLSRMRPRTPCPSRRPSVDSRVKVRDLPSRTRAMFQRASSVVGNLDQFLNERLL